MKFGLSKSESLNRLKSHTRELDSIFKVPDSDPPMRSELFNAEQMEQHGKVLAGHHILDSAVKPNQQLLSRLNENEEILIEVHNLILESVKARRQITPAGEWLLDNFYLIEDHIRTAKRHLPKRYSEELPKLINGNSRGLPRVYDMVTEIISHGDGSVDTESLTRFIRAYQTIDSLKIGELWAIPIMLRLALIENLRRVAFRVALGRIDRNLADFWADQMMEIAEKDPKSLIIVTADMARSDPPMSAPFISEFIRRLQGQSTILGLPVTWIEQRLSQSNQTIGQLIQTGNQQLASDQVSISNSISSLRFLGAMNWKDFVEGLSAIDKVLTSDPAEAYLRMDFTTRDLYRHVIEDISKKSTFSEHEVAWHALELSAKAAQLKGNQDRTAHVGYYLVDKGLSTLERITHKQFSLPSKIRKTCFQWPLVSYLSSILLLTLLFSWVFIVSIHKEVFTLASSLAIDIIILLSFSYLAIAIVNWLVTLLAPPKPLPRFDLSDGIPLESRTLVVVPSMLSSINDIDNLAEALEVRFLANRDDNLFFGLLTDFLDAELESLPEDESLTTHARIRIQELNKRYAKNIDIFYLFHRPRKWNRSEKKWMGFERKRGKLSDLNALISGKAHNRFSLLIGNTKNLIHIKYVITLDIDTELPRDSARQLIGTMSHPLNRPKFDKRRGIVTDGYTILQPRVAVSLPGTNKSRYAHLFGSEPGIDPYTRTISDVYQDLFLEGSFIGKGIYDVESFENVFSDRFPENRILSHDLLEGCYSRSALLSDVLLFEEYPATYFADVSRRHRWIRGDWQLLPWITPFVRDLKFTSKRNPLSALSKWKLFDNFRRSLVPIALMLMLILGWTIFPAHWIWTFAIIGIVLLPSLVITVIDVINKPLFVDFRQHLTGSRQLLINHLLQAAFFLICLPYEAYYSLDAILRTLWRIGISKKNLLEWNTAANTGPKNLKISGLYKSMWFLPALSILIILYLIIFDPTSLLTSWPFLIIWLVSPVVIWWFDKPIPKHIPQITTAQFRFLYDVSRRTWAFFETYVTAADNWLPPDNFQEHPNAVIAHRTSPTNIGLSLLANLTAYDFGYIYTSEVIERLSNTLITLNQMERYRGHFYNWYDTESLKPLFPLYVSSVDSGNLAGSILTLRSGLQGIPDQKILGSRYLEGINDTLNILSRLYSGKAPEILLQFRRILETYMSSPPVSLNEAWLCLSKLAESSAELTGYIQGSTSDRVVHWATALSKQCQKALDEMIFLVPWIAYPAPGNNGLVLEEIPTLRQLANLGEEYNKPAVERMSTIEKLITDFNDLSWMDYEFLYDPSRHLQSVGFNVEDRRPDASYYDLLASEARLSSFVAIAQGKVPQESWFALSRMLAGTPGEPILMSWSGSMFEYLMPLIIMPIYENTLLYQACNAAITSQIEYGKKHGIPWGISESGYNSYDLHLNYQYRAFGVPGLGLKRGLSEDLVIAPYATALALILMPEEACVNLERMASEGFMGEYGFYEAIDYTPSRLPRGQTNVIIKSYMSHHVGMSFLSLSGFLLNNPMQKRFESDTLLQASILLLHERIPRYTSFFSNADTQVNLHTNINTQEIPIRIYDSANTPYPQIHLLSNGRYQVMITNAGGGYSRWNDLAVSRWREDTTRDSHGLFCYIRDAESGYYWSTAYQPTLQKPDKYEAIFSEGRAEFRRRDKEINTHTEIVVSPEDDIELRRINLKNRTQLKKIIDITSYMEVVMALPAAEAAHPAFNNLFIQTEIIYQRQAILCTRRPRSPDENVPVLFHQMAAHGAEIVNITYETDRSKFLGRGNSPEAPIAMTELSALSNTEGSVLDPIVAVQFQIILEPEGTATIDVITGMVGTREHAMMLIEKYQDKLLANRVFELAWTHSQVVLQQINAVESDAQLYGQLAGSIIYANPDLRPESSVIIRNRRGQSALWGYSISGDLPVVLVQVEDPQNINIVRQLIQAHAYWRLKGLIVDMVVWIEDYAGYRQSLYEQIMGIIAAGIGAGMVGRQGGIFVRSGDQLSADDRLLFQAIARIVITDKKGTLADQLSRRVIAENLIPGFKPSRSNRTELYTPAIQSDPNLVFFNGTGGFTQDGREYIIFTSKEKPTPAPWVNVIANKKLGTVLSENGQSYTWYENAHEYRLTPWNNDPVTDLGGEAIYIRDEESGIFWTPTPLIKIEKEMFKTRHGFGYSIFEYIKDGIASELCVYVDLSESVKFSVLKIRNLSGRSRKISVTGYVEWVLGDLRQKTAMHVISEADLNSNAIFVRNPYSIEFYDRAAFFQTSDVSACTFTCDRTEFLGRNGSIISPAAMKKTKLSGKKGAAMDPCTAIQIPIELTDKQEYEIVFSMGSGRNMPETIKLANMYRGAGAARKSLEQVWEFWKLTLGAIHIDTPDVSLNFLVNGWLIYQTISSRIWARSGFYQSGGAYGFRDQLQDVMALIHCSPGLFREQILFQASRQFIEGDVQHWWHPPAGRGVRTHCSDDYLWLPLAICRYVKCTGDNTVLDETIPFLDGRLVNIEEDSYYDLPVQSGERGTLYNHCVRAIQYGLKYGEHGIPLMGSHDWNDGMNKVGDKGKGESVWLGFFLYDILLQFSALAENYGDSAFAMRCKTEAAILQENIEHNAWDGDWYLRAFFDDGTPLGSKINPECSIDSLSQSWAVISGAGNQARSVKAMESVYQKLVRRDKALVQLLDPPFDKSNLNPGYIKGYIPGVRENGGQYTHAAIWTAMAFSELGDIQKAWEVLNLINPIRHGITSSDVAVYKVEPYVIAADVYSLPPHTGRGGWTWYTGSASWMYRLIVESLLGLRIEGDRMFIEPLIPQEWQSFSIDYRVGQSTYHIEVNKTTEDMQPNLNIDGIMTDEKFIRIINDDADHRIVVTIST